MMKDEDLKLLRGFAVGQTNGQTFVIAFATEKNKKCGLFPH